ncbi:MAG: glycosyltransferase family 39 protein [bacterium]
MGIEMTKKMMLFFLFFSGLFIALSILLYINVPAIKAHLDVDSSGYLYNGLIFYEYGSFVKLGSQPYYALGYPFFIGLLYKIFGVNVSAVILLQVVLALLCGFLLFIIAQRLFNRWVALVTFIFFSCNIGFLTFSQFILTEILLAFLLILFFERFTAFIQNQDKLILGISGFILGASIIVKPAALYYLFFLIPAIVLLTQGLLRCKFHAALVFSLCFYIPILGYMTHNMVTFGNFKTGTLKEVNICYWLFPNMLAHANQTNSDIEREKLQRMPSQKHVMQYFKEFSKQHPLTLVYVWLKNVFKTWVGLFTTNLKVLIDPHVSGGQISYFKMSGSFLQKAFNYATEGTTILWLKIVGFLETLWSIIRLLLVLTTLFFLLMHKKFALLYIISSYLFYFSMITGHDGCARFRMMFEFLLIILAAAGLWILLNRSLSSTQLFMANKQNK